MIQTDKTNISLSAEKKSTSEERVTLRYAMWDEHQLPGYKACARLFEAKHPNISIEIDQTRWDDYWQKLEGDILLRAVPDVFLNHVIKIYTHGERGLLLDLEPFVRRDKFDLSIYQENLANLWCQEGKRYALPKDWDTVAVIYNADMFTKAGIDPISTMRNWNWHTDGTGVFNQVIARLTLDIAGNNGLNSAFNKSRILQYGFTSSGGCAPAGQISWSHFAMSNGAPPLLDKRLGTRFTFDDPKRAEAIQWYADLHLLKSFASYLSVDTSGLDQEFFIYGKSAMITDGSWRINQYVNHCRFNVRFGQLPVGTAGRKTMLNGLGDSIWKGTAHPEEAWEWVKFLGSSEAQDIIAEAGLVFPAVKSSTQKALNMWARKGVDVSAFTNQIKNPWETFFYPVSNRSNEVHSIIEPTLNLIMLGVTKAAPALKSANERINALFS